MGNTDIAKEQILWEHDKLINVTHVLFWFPKETLCPITLYELGFFMGLRSNNHGPCIDIGCHPDYQRKLDVEIQTNLIPQYQKIIFDTLEGTVNHMIEKLKWA